MINNYKIISMKNLLLSLLLITLPLFSVLAQDSDVKEIKIKTSAVCDMCKTTIEKDMKFEKGVKSAELDVESKILTVQYKPSKTNPDKIRHAVAKVGYDADNIPAVPESYDNLDPCCKKDAHQDEGMHE